MKTKENKTADETLAHMNPSGADVSPAEAGPKKKAGRQDKAHTGAKKASGAKTAKKGAKPVGRPGSSAAKILELIGRAKGATLAELVKASGWQAHSVRGFLSTARKKRGLPIDSSRNDSGDRVYEVGK